MSDVYVIEALRTPFGSFGGTLADVSAPQLASTVIKGLLAKSGLEPAAVDEVIIGQVLSGGCGQAPARQAMRLAGLPDSTHAMTINKVCGSGLKAIMLGAGSIMLGDSRVVIAGGMENMSSAPYVLKKARGGYRLGHGEIHDLMICDGLQDPCSGRLMGEIGEESAIRHGLSRSEMDEYALRSYQLARTAVREGIFRDEIVAVAKQGSAKSELIGSDEEPFRLDPARLSQLRPAFSGDGAITAGNASAISDGAALAMLTDETGVTRSALKPKARIVASATESRHPDHFPEAPVGAIRRVCERAGLALATIDLFEINEAFASVALSTIKSLHLDPERVNVNGGAVAIGHPIGASGARLAATVIRELHRRQARYGLATLCIGGGEAVAVIFERV
ncbi:MAG: acetyl-CoA acetyltransferase [Geobacteraceae bacterium GWC2_55_20]|nr:MAG: acetyl-CoA acetyltransferase [Geobacteraceae bacterium GWC2_55_20]